jgi:hypothetical protein
LVDQKAAEVTSAELFSGRDDLISQCLVEQKAAEVTSAELVRKPIEVSGAELFRKPVEVSGAELEVVEVHSVRLIRKSLKSGAELFSGRDG